MAPIQVGTPLPYPQPAIPRGISKLMEANFSEPASESQDVAHELNTIEPGLDPSKNACAGDAQADPAPEIDGAITAIDPPGPRTESPDIILGWGDELDQPAQRVDDSKSDRSRDGKKRKRSLPDDYGPVDHQKSAYWRGSHSKLQALERLVTRNNTVRVLSSDLGALQVGEMKDPPSVCTNLECAFPEGPRKWTLVEVTLHPYCNFSFYLRVIIHDTREEVSNHQHVVQTIASSGYVGDVIISSILVEPLQPHLHRVTGFGIGRVPELLAGTLEKAKNSVKVSRRILSSRILSRRILSRRI